MKRSDRLPLGIIPVHAAFLRSVQATPAPLYRGPRSLALRCSLPFRGLQSACQTDWIGSRQRLDTKTSSRLEATRTGPAPGSLADNLEAPTRRLTSARSGLSLDHSSSAA